MSQISMPYRIALIAIVAIALVWFITLRPKDESGGEATTPPPAQTEAGPAQPDADGAPAATAPGAGGRQGLDVAGTGTGSATDATPIAGFAGVVVAGRDVSARARLSGPQRAATALAEDRVLVLGFFNRRAPDDRAVRRELDALNTRRGRVIVVSAPLTEVARYDAVLGGVTVATSPTVVVVGFDRSARTLAGFIDGGTLTRVVETTLAPSPPRR